jgi:predicted nucleotidyltransferase
MMTTNTIPDTWAVANHIATLRRHLPSLTQQYHIKALGVFGSYVSNEQTPTSDLDILVEFEDFSHLSLFSYVGIQHTLSAIVGKEVDLVLRDGLKPSIRETVLQEVIWI